MTGGPPGAPPVCATVGYPRTIGSTVATSSGLIKSVTSTVDEYAPDLKDLKDLAGRVDLKDLPDLDELRDRAEDLRDRAEDVSTAVRDGVDDLGPLLRRTVINVLEAFQAVLRVVLALPRLAVKLLGLLRVAAVHAEDARERGHELTERARDRARAIPPSRRGRWANRARTVGLFGGGFAAGAAVGWLLASRRAPEYLQDSPVVLQPVGDDVDADEGDAADGPEAGTGA